MAGLESYIYGYNELLEYEPILKCLSKKLDIELFLVKKLDLEQDKPRNIPDVSSHFKYMHVINQSVSPGRT